MFPAPYGEEAPDPATVGEEELLAVLTSYPTVKLEKTLAALLRSPDPLLSYRAATFLVEAAISPSDFPLGAWYLDRIGTLVAADRHYITCLPPPPRGVANLIEACRRLVGTLEEADEEEEEEAAEEAKESARKPGAQWDCLMWIAFQLSALKSLATCYVEDPASAAAPAEERELPLIGLLKLIREMLPWRSRLMPMLALGLCKEVKGLCRAAWEATGKGAVSDCLPSPFSGYVVARQLALELAMEYVGEVCASPRDIAYDFNALWRDVPIVIPEAEELEPSGDDDEGACSLVRKPRSSDLLPYRLAFLAKLLRRVAEAAANDDGLLLWPLNGTWMELLSLVRCFMTAGRSHELISALVNHDDLLMGTLLDLQCACVALLTNPPTLIPRMFPPEVDIDEAQAALRGFQRTAFPPLVFLSLLQAVDEELFLDYLISNETSALEYLTRAVKFLVWHLGSNRDGQGGKEGEGEQNEAVAKAAAFLVALGARLQGLVDRNLFPYDIRPLLERVRELREALDG